MQLPGMGYKDYWPVVFQNKVFIRLMGKATDNSTFHALDEADGVERFANLFQYDGQTINGTTTPPCVNAQGHLIVPANYPNDWRSGWGEYDLTANTVSPLLNASGGYAGFGNDDENLNQTCTQNLILGMHTQEMNANFTGFYNYANGSWTSISPGWTNQQMRTNTQGGGGNPATVAGNMVYHISFYELVARSAQ